MSDLVREIGLKLNKHLKKQTFNSGDTVGVYVKVREGEKERLQLFKGVVIQIKGSGSGRSFTVRKISNGVGVERTFPLISPAIERIEVVSTSKVRRSKLFYLRGLRGRSARLKAQVYAEGEAVGAADQIASDAVEGVTASTDTPTNVTKPVEKKTKSDAQPKADAKSAKTKPADKNPKK